MIQLARTVTDKFPHLLASSGKRLVSPGKKLMEKLHTIPEIDAVIDHSVGCFDFIDQLFDQFNFTYQVTAQERQFIPDYGRVVIVANQPFTPLHALAILRLVSEVRRDIKLVMADGFANSPALAPVIINSTLESTDYREKINQALADEQAVILFPSAKSFGGRISKGKHQLWRPDFLHYSRNCNSPILPILIQPQKRLRRLSNSLLMKARSGKAPRSVIKLCIGEAIAADALFHRELGDKALTHRFRKHLFKLAKKQSSTFETVKTIAHPENRLELQTELTQAERLGATRDQNEIYLCDFRCTTLMREVGRMREISFRKVGEGTGSKRDLDEFDRYYQHLILWNKERMEVAGAYRLGHASTIINTLGAEGL